MVWGALLCFCLDIQGLDGFLNVEFVAGLCAERRISLQTFETAGRIADLCAVSWVCPGTQSVPLLLLSPSTHGHVRELKL